MIAILEYGQVKNEEIFARVTPTVNVTDIVAEIIRTVRQDGDAALYRYCEKFDGVKPESLLVTPQELEEAEQSVEPRFLEVLRKAAANIRAFH